MCPNIYKFYGTVFQLEPSFRSALFNIALMLVNNLKKPLEAVPYLQSLLEVNTWYTTNKTLLKDILLVILEKFTLIFSVNSATQKICCPLFT